MKKLVLLLLSLSLFTCNNEPKVQLAPDAYQIDVNAKGVYNGMRAYIKQIGQTRKEVVLDTAIVMNEQFTFDGFVKNPKLTVITVDGIRQTLPFVLEAGHATINLNKDDLQSSVVKGAQNTELYTKYINEQANKSNALNQTIAAMRNAQSNGDAAKAQELNLQSKQMKADLANFAHEFITSHPNNEFSLLLLESKLTERNPDIELYKKSLAALESVVQSSPENKQIGAKVINFIKIFEAQANVNIGKVAPDFSAPTPEGAQLALNDIKGKATIIDFWASWCRPCRMENPNVVRVYEKYHDKGLEIISVSLDKQGQKSRWLKAIEDDKMNWHHVSNLQYWSEPVARMYNVSSIPATFILDENGTIVAKKLRGKALEDKIAELLD